MNQVKRTDVEVLLRLNELAKDELVMAENGLPSLDDLLMGATWP